MYNDIKVENWMSPFMPISIYKITRCKDSEMAFTDIYINVIISPRR